MDTADGFQVAEVDLRMRGMGDLFGKQQHGEATLRVANPFRDLELNELSREAARRLLERDPELTSKENALIHLVLKRRYATAPELFRVGLCYRRTPAPGTSAIEFCTFLSILRIHRNTDYTDS